MQQAGIGRSEAAAAVEVVQVRLIVDVQLRHAVHAGPLVEARTLHPRNIVQQDEHVPVEAVHADKLSHVIITCNMYRRRAAMPPVGPKKEAAEAAS